MPYRKVTYLEQMWYLLRYKIRELLRREEKGAHDMIWLFAASMAALLFWIPLGKISQRSDADQAPAEGEENDRA